jgi:hypothetical protein
MSMKKFAVLPVLMLIAGCVTAQSPRRALLEVFTNASCSPCAPYQDALHPLLDTLSVPWTMVQYHVDWPSIDPMNAHNPGDPSARRFYYNVSGVPRGHIDGAVIGGYINATDVQSAQAIPASFDIGLSHWLSGDGDSIYVRAAYKATQAVSGNLKSFVSIQERRVHFDHAPGYNGETEFWNVHKMMLPGSNGFSLPNSFAVGDSVVWTGAWLLANIYEYSELCVTAWVQDYTTKQVFQAAYSPPQPLLFQLDLSATLGKTVNVTGSGGGSTFTADLSTTLGTADVYEFTLDKTGLPAGWSATITAGATTDPTTVESTIAGNGSASVTLQIVSGTADDETGVVRLIANNKNQFPGYTKSLDFKVHANPTNLIVHANDFGDAWYFPWYLDSANAPHVTLLEPEFDGIDLAQFTSANIDHIFYNTMSRAGATLITDPQIAKLTAFLQSGGDMLIQGQDIGYSQNLTSASQAFKNFYRDYLGAQYLADWSLPDSFLYAAPTDSIFGPTGYLDTLNFSWYFPYADLVTTIGPHAHACIHYGYTNNATAGIRNEDPALGWKTVYLAWSAKTSWNDGAKDELFAKAIEWFDMAAPVGAPSPQSPASVVCTVYPQPAGAYLDIAVAGLKGPAECVLLDLYGRELARHPVGAGSAPLRIPTDRLPQGVYGYRISRGDVLLAVGKLVVGR